MATRDCCCAKCGGILRKGQHIVYRHKPGAVLCIACAEKDPAVKWTPSVQWEAWRKKAVA